MSGKGKCKSGKPIFSSHRANRCPGRRNLSFDGTAGPDLRVDNVNALFQAKEVCGSEVGAGAAGCGRVETAGCQDATPASSPINERTFAKVDAMAKFAWIESLSANVQRELRRCDDGRLWVYETTGDEWVECWKCGRISYIKEISDPDRCPSCGWEGHREEE